MAYACRRRGIVLTIYASVNANPLKVERMRALGARVLLHGADFDAAKLEAKRVATATGVSMVEDGREPRLAEGAGSIAVERRNNQARLCCVLGPGRTVRFDPLPDVRSTTEPSGSPSGGLHRACHVDGPRRDAPGN
jgi:hypothetical protein